MTGAAGRRQGGDFLPLKPPAKRDAFHSTCRRIYRDFWSSLDEAKKFSPASIEMYTSILYKMRIAGGM